MLVDTLPEDVCAEALALISDLIHADDGQLSEDEIMSLDEADVAIAAGEVRPLSEARRDLGLRSRPREDSLSRTGRMARAGAAK